MTQSGTFLSPGTQVIQVRKGPSTLPAVATAIGGFLVYAQMGPVGVPIQVVSPDDSAEVFGGRITAPGNSRLADSLIDYFAEGGTTCYIMRFAGVGAAAAARTLYTVGLTYGQERSSPGSFPVTNFTAGETLIGAVNGGGTATATIQATAAAVTGTAATYAAVAPGHTLTVFINGVLGNQVITFAGTEANQAAFLTTINAQLRGATSVNSGGQLEIQTTVKGSSAGGSIVGGSADVLASLGLTPEALVNAGPNNVANLASVQALEVATILSATFAGTSTTVNGDNSITWQTNTLGASGSVQFTGGTGLSNILGFDELLHSGVNTLPLPTVVLQAASGQYLSPGTWANSYSSLVTQVNTYVTNPVPTAAGVTTTLVVANSARLNVGDTFSITVGDNVQRATILNINGNTLTLAASITVPSGGYVGTEQVILETWNLTVYDNSGDVVIPSPFTGLRSSPLSPNYFVNVINNTPRSPVVVTDLAPSISDPRPITDTAPGFFAGGLDGAAPVANDVISQIQNWDQAQDVNMISIPGVATDFPGSSGIGILVAQQAYGENRADLMIVLDEPQGIPGIGPGGARDWIQNTANLASSYEAVYWPWVQRLDVVTGTLKSFPPSPHVQGCAARTNYNSNFATSPAGLVNGQLQNVVTLDTIVMEQGPEYNDAYPANVNFILKFPGQGFAIWGNRTLDPTGEFGAWNVQYGFNIAKRTIKQGTRFVNFSYNNPSTRQSVVRVLTALFRGWRTAGILAGASDSQAFFIICDDTNNTPLVISQGLLVCRIGLAFQTETEFQEYTLEQDTQAVDQQLAQQAATGSSTGS